jgi:hypothetical protein
MTGPAPALGPDLAHRDFLTACASLAGIGSRHGALRPGPLEPSFESAEAHAVWEAILAVFHSTRSGGLAVPGISPACPPPAWTGGWEDLLRSPAAGRALSHFGDAQEFGNPSAGTEETERRNLAGFAENTPERIQRMLEKKRALDRKALAAFRLKHGKGTRAFTAMEAGQRREYLWMWAQSAYLARRRFARAAEAWARASA